MSVHESENKADIMHSENSSKIERGYDGGEINSEEDAVAAVIENDHHHEAPVRVKYHSPALEVLTRHLDYGGGDQARPS